MEVVFLELPTSFCNSVHTTLSGDAVTKLGKGGVRNKMTSKGGVSWGGHLTYLASVLGACGILLTIHSHK